MNSSETGYKHASNWKEAVVRMQEVQFPMGKARQIVQRNWQEKMKAGEHIHNTEKIPESKTSYLLDTKFLTPTVTKTVRPYLLCLHKFS